MFVADNSGTAAYVLRFGRGPRLVTKWQNGTSGTSPMLAGGLLYVYDQQGGALKVYAPASGRLLASLAAASGHWNSPIAIGGRVILPTGNANDHDTSGELFIFHLPALRRGVERGTRAHGSRLRVIATTRGSGARGAYGEALGTGSRPSSQPSVPELNTSAPECARYKRRLREVLAEPAASARRARVPCRRRGPTRP